MENWSQVTFETAQSPDELLLVDVWAPILEQVRPRLVAWHFFWEPDLWIRLRWRSEEDRDAGNASIEKALEAASDWRIEAFEWEQDAQLMGLEMWGRCQRDWMNGSELALSLITKTRDGSASKQLDFHWARHVHLLSNQLTGTWAEEARLCVRQARYRIWLLSRMQGNEEDRPTLQGLVEKLDEVAAETDRLAAGEQRFLAAWRADGRPPLGGRLDLPDGFAEERAMNGVTE